MQVNNLYSQVSSKVKFSIVICRYAASNFVFIQDSTAIPFRHIKPKLLKILFEHHGGIGGAGPAVSHTILYPRRLAKMSKT